MLISLILSLVILGAVLYLLELLPIDGTIKQIIKVIVIVAIVIYCIQILLGSNGALLKLP